jgi:topoisomerase-4 subunit A
LYFTANPNGEAELVNVQLKPLAKLKRLRFDLDFSDLTIKGRQSKGNLVTKFPIKKIEMREKGVSTLSARRIWFDDTVKRLNADGRGTLLGAFKGEDKILTMYQSGYYRLSNFDLSTHFDEDLTAIEKWNPDRPISAVYWDGKKQKFFVKRFLLDGVEKKELFISEEPGSYVEVATTAENSSIEIKFKKIKGVEKDPVVIQIDEFISVKGIKAQGNQLTADAVREINYIAPEVIEPETTEDLPEEQPEEIITNEENITKNGEGPVQITLDLGF